MLGGRCIVDIELALDTNAVTLLANPLAVGLSRALVRTSLIARGYRSVVDDAEMVVSELATNAVHATDASEPDWYVNSISPPALIKVTIEYYRQHVIISVWDRSPAEPKQASAAHSEESGRGLVIVDALSTRWGWDTVHPYSGYKGKVVWAELALPPMPVSPSGLPLRMPGQRAVEVTVPIERAVLVRVRDGLKRL